MARETTPLTGAARKRTALLCPVLAPLLAVAGADSSVSPPPTSAPADATRIVRGGRVGEMQWTLNGVTPNRPLRDRAAELPHRAVECADLLCGGLDAEYTGALAGVIELKTWNPGEHPRRAPRWLPTGRRTLNAGCRRRVSNGGGAYLDPRLSGGRSGWVPVNDARLRRPPRSVRVGIELGW